jgi:hypothetical protein
VKWKAEFGSPESDTSTIQIGVRGPKGVGMAAKSWAAVFQFFRMGQTVTLRNSSYLAAWARHVSAIHQLVAMREASDVLRQRVVGGAWMKAFRGIGHPSLSIGIKSLCLRLRLYGRLTQTVKTYLAVR